MCDRYVVPDQVTAEREFLPAQAWWKFEARFNVAAQQYVPAIRVYDGQSEGLMIRWGLIPSWAEGQPTGQPRACAELERIERSKAYRMPWLSGQRCILPVSGFYAWRLTEGNYRQPFFVRLANRSVFGLAAVWDRSETEDGDVIEIDCAKGIFNVDVSDEELAARVPAQVRKVSQWGIGRELFAPFRQVVSAADKGASIFSFDGDY